MGRPRGSDQFHAGDKITVGVWNAQTGAGPANYELTVGTASKNLTPPHIASVTPVYPGAGQDFIIKGEGFGGHPIDSDSDYFMTWNETVTWLAQAENPNPDPIPHTPGFEPVTVKISRWTSNEIEVTGFGEAYGSDNRKLNVGDKIKVNVWNVQTSAGPAGMIGEIVPTANKK